MKKLKLLLTLLLCVICLLSFTACNKKDFKIGVQSGTTGELYVKGDSDMMFDGFANNECLPYDNGGLAVQAMINGQVDFVIIDNEPAKQLVGQNPGIKIIDIPLTTEQYAYGIDKNQPELLSSVNAIITAIKGDGRLQAIFDKYDALQYDNEGNVIGGDDAIVGIESATKNNSNPQGQLVIATNAAFAPYEYKKGNKFAGIDMEVAQLIANELSLELVIEDMEFVSVVTSVGINNVDVAMSGLTVTASRKEVVNFSEVYYEGVYQVLIVKDSETRFDNVTTKEQIENILKGN